MESTTQRIKVEQSQSDRSKKAFPSCQVSIENIASLRKSLPLTSFIWKQDKSYKYALKIGMCSFPEKT